MTTAVATPAVPAPVRIRNAVDARLGKVTMYRLVAFCLGLLVVLAFALSFAGILYYEAAALAATLIVLLGVTYGSNRLYGAMFGVRPHAPVCCSSCCGRAPSRRSCWPSRWPPPPRRRRNT
jgi:hypothetical protein